MSDGLNEMTKLRELSEFLDLILSCFSKCDQPSNTYPCCGRCRWQRDYDGHRAGSMNWCPITLDVIVRNSKRRIHSFIRLEQLVNAFRILAMHLAIEQTL